MKTKFKGNALKAISKTETELRVGNYIVLFGSPQQRDLEFARSGRNPDGSLGEYFTPDVDVESKATKAGKFEVDFEHGNDEEVGERVLGYVDWRTARRDEKGIFVERVLERRRKYVRFLEELIEAGLIGSSSEAEPMAVKTLNDGAIIRWPLICDTLTVMPTEPRMMTENTLSALKNLAGIYPAAKSLLDAIEKNPEGNSGKTTGGATRAAAGARKPAGVNQPTRSKAMDILEAIKKLIPGLKDEVYQQIAIILGLTGVSVTPTEEPAVDAAGEEIKSISMSKLVSGLKSMGYEVTLPGQKPAKKAAVVRPPFAFGDAGGDEDPDEDEAAKARAKSMEAAYLMRFTDETEAQKAILTDLVGADYRQQIHEQDLAYTAYLRGGESNLSTQERKSLKRLIFPVERVTHLIREGYSVQAIKAVQVEAMGELGGYAVPPNRQSEISKRLPGLTAVRGAGARVVELVNSNSIEIPTYEGNSDRYIGLIRGQWGNETKTPTDQNYKLKMVDVVANVYTYKVPMSQSLVEDASNLVSLVNDDIIMTGAIDEDEVFLVGDGIGKPLGILPGGANTLSLREVISQDMNTLTAAGIKALKRGVPSQYRGRGVFVANSDTYGVIENLTYGATGEFVFEDLSETELLLKRKAYESGAMADVAANAYPIMFGDMNGYTIVERLGMSIQRYQDSGTGPNKVEFHVRRRIGGRVEKPWLFAVQKVDDDESI